MPPIQSKTNFSPSEETRPPLNMGSHTKTKPSLYFIGTISITIICGVLLLLSFKMPILRKHRIKIIVAFIATAVLAMFLPSSMRQDIGMYSSRRMVAGPPVDAPDVSGKIHGVWANMPLAEKVVRDGDWMREVGINTLTFNPSMFHDEIGNITEEENAEEKAKHTINVIHEAGMRVMMEPSPLKAETAPEVEQSEVFMKQMEKISVKYAKIAEEYNVEYYSPLAEPVNHLGPVNADKFMQDVLPKIRKVYNGTVVYKKTSIDFTTLLEWRQDTTVEVDFLLTGSGSSFAVDILADKNRKVYSQAEPNRYSAGEFSNGQGREILAKSEDIQTDHWYRMRVDVRGNKISTYLNDKLISEYDDRSAKERAHVLSGIGFKARNLKVTNKRGKTIYQDDFTFSHKWNINEGNWVIKDGEMHALTRGYAEMIYDIDFSGYDVLAINMFREGTHKTDKEYRDYVRYLINRTKEQAADDGVPTVILGEFGGTTLPVMDWVTGEIDSSPLMTNAQLARTARMVMEEAEDTTEGYYYFGWDREGQGIAVIPEVEQVVKSWYNTH